MTHHFLRKRILVRLLVLSLFMSGACNKQESVEPEVRSLTYRTRDYSGDIAYEWMELGAQMIRDNKLYAPHAARIYGYMGLIMWESVYGGIPGAKSMAKQVNDYPEAAQIFPERAYDWGIVMCRAMEIATPALVDRITSAQRGAISALAERQEAEMKALHTLTEDVRQNARDLGTRVGLRMIERIKKDNREIIRTIVPVLPERDAQHKWYWDPKTFGQDAVEPLWSTLRTFVVDNAQSCEAEGPLPYSEESSSLFYKEALEVYETAKNAGNKAIAYHWDDTPSRTCSSACHWVSIATQLLRRENKNLAESAKTYCILGLALSDAFTACWYMKYKYNLLRPATYIRENIDPGWTALLHTPPYPEYTSGAAMAGGAGSTALKSVFGDTPFIDKTHLGSALYTPDGGPFILPERMFHSLTQAGEEQMNSRIVGGLSFRRACTEGLKAGRCISNTILNRLHFE